MIVVFLVLKYSALIYSRFIMVFGKMGSVPFLVWLPTLIGLFVTRYSRLTCLYFSSLLFKPNKINPLYPLCKYKGLCAYWLYNLFLHHCLHNELIKQIMQSTCSVWSCPRCWPAAVSETNALHCRGSLLTHLLRFIEHINICHHSHVWRITCFI